MRICSWVWAYPRLHGYGHIRSYMLKFVWLFKAWFLNFFFNAQAQKIWGMGIPVVIHEYWAYFDSDRLKETTLLYIQKLNKLWLVWSEKVHLKSWGYSNRGEDLLGMPWIIRIIFFSKYFPLLILFLVSFDLFSFI